MIKEIEARQMLITNQRPAKWFGVKYYFNIYRGCMHGCIYCDSRSKCYQIENFDTEMLVKTNAIELLRKEIAYKRYRETIGFGSTSDPYVPIEKKYELTKQALDEVRKFRFPLFLLTKSNMVLRDINLINEINKQNYACVAFTITTADDKLAKIIEPNAPLPSERLKAMSVLSLMGIRTGVVVMPVLPYITDTEENMVNLVKSAKENDAKFIYPSYSVTLRDRQRDYFYERISDKTREKYIKRFRYDYQCTSPNYKKLKTAFEEACKEYDISREMPSYAKENSVTQLDFFKNSNKNLSSE